VTEQDTTDTRSRGARWLMLLALVTVSLVTAALGIWQVQRLAWKRDLIARVEARVAAAPVAPPPQAEWPRITPEAYEYRRVTASGTYLHDKEALVVASTERGPGYWVMTPLAREDGTIVIVNRGFVPPDRRSAASRAADIAVAEGTVTGLLRMSEVGQWILRANDPATDRWYRRDPTAIGAARGLAPVAPFFIDADATANPGGWPVGGLTRVAFSNNHLVYVLVWFALALLAAGGAVYVLRTDFART